MIVDSTKIMDWRIPYDNVGPGVVSRIIHKATLKIDQRWDLR